MQIQVSKTFLKWKDDNKSNKTLMGVIDKFLLQVFMAPDMSGITPQPKAAGKNLRKSVGTVDEFVRSKRYRFYSKFGEFVPGNRIFRLAIGGIKGKTKQNEDVISALTMFDKGSTEEWVAWEPENMPAPVQTVMQNVAPADDTIGAPDASKKKKSKGKPLDENGLTVAERKALAKQKREEEIRAAKQKKDAEQRAASAAAATAAATAPVASTDATAPETPAPITENRAKVEHLKQALNMLHAVLANENADKSDVTPTTDTSTPVHDAKAVPASSDSAKDAASVVPASDMLRKESATPTGDEKFEPVLDVQYELDIIEHQMNIEASKIIIAQQRIDIENAKIATELLAIKKLQLLQAQKQPGK